MSKKFLIIGSGFSGATCARLLAEKGHAVRVLEKAVNVGGACHDELAGDGTCFVHKFGPHIFHTENEEVWKFVNRFGEFNSYRHMYKSLHEGKMYTFPINFNTMYELYGKRVYTKETADRLIAEDAVKNDDPKNFEEAALNAVGRRIYDAFIRNYTMKQWHTDPKNLPVETFKRIGIRYNFDDGTFQGQFQGMPVNGYTKLIERMLEHENIEVLLNVRDDEFIEMSKDYDKVIYTGGFKGMPYRSIEFVHYVADAGTDAVVNLPDDPEATRETDFNILHGVKESDVHHYCKEYPANDNEFNELYPIATEENMKKLEQCQDELRRLVPNVVFCGRLGTYKYLDMDKAIMQAMLCVDDLEENARM